MDITGLSRATAAPAALERRRSPRVELLAASLYGTVGVVDVVDVHVLVREASHGGFSVESQLRFLVGSEHTFRFWNRAGGSATAIAVCRHTRRVAGHMGGGRYESGFEFAPQPAENLQLVFDAIDAEMESVKRE